MHAELPHWFKFRPAVVFSSPEFHAATHDAELARALLRLMSWNWRSGPIEKDRSELGMMLGLCETSLALLEVHGIVRSLGNGRVEASLDWLVQARDEALEYSRDQSTRGKASRRAQVADSYGARRSVRTVVEPALNQRSANAQPAFSQRSTSAQPALNQERRGEESREDQRTSPSTALESAAAAGESLFAGERALKPGSRRSTKKPSAAESWERVLGRPQYAILRNSAQFMSAWRDWIDWCGASEAEAELPVGAQATRMFNRALPDPDRYARALQLSIERNYKGVDPNWLQEPRAGHGPASVPKGEAAAVRAIAMGREVLGRLEGRK